MKIDLFLHQNSLYEALDAFTHGLNEALSRAEVETKVHKTENKNPTKFLTSIEKDRPNYTLSFNGLLPDSEGRFLCDMIQIPHIACLVDSPSWFLPLKDSSLTLIACPDRFHVDFFKSVGASQVFFMTQGCDPNLVPDDAATKKYDVTMLSSCIDIEEILEMWKKTFSEKMVQALLHAADIALKDPKISYWQAFSEGMFIHHPADPLDLLIIVEILKELERYINGLDRIQLLKHLPHLTIDVFGNDESQPRSWSYYLKNCSNIRFHPPVSFKEHLKVLQESRILLNSLAKVRQGGNERVFNGYLLGALSVSSENTYLREFYEDDHSILYYRYGSYHTLEQKIQDLLKDQKKIDAMTAEGRKITLENHTWDNRVHDLLEQLKTFKKAQ